MPITNDLVRRSFSIEKRGKGRQTVYRQNNPNPKGNMSLTLPISPRLNVIDNYV